MNQDLLQHFNNYGAVYSVLGGLVVMAQISLVLAQMMRGFGQQQRQMQMLEHHETERRAIEAQQLELERQRDAAWQQLTLTWAGPAGAKSSAVYPHPRRGEQSSSFYVDDAPTDARLEVAHPESGLAVTRVEWLVAAE